MDTVARTATSKGKAVHLTPLEFALLEFFVRNPERLCSRNELLDAVWGSRFKYDTGTIDVHLNAIRRKMGFDRHQPLETIRGGGFVLHTGAQEPYTLTIQPFVREWLDSHAGEFAGKGLVPQMRLDPFVSEITLSPTALCTMLDSILAAILPTITPETGKHGVVKVTSRLTMTHFSLRLDINDTTNELRIPINR